jgi:hypothetical protein
MSNRGVFQIDMKVWEEIGNPRLQAVHSTLLLPSAYQIMEIIEHKYSSTECVMKVYVISPLIPDQLGIAELAAYYRREDEKPCFDHMEIKGENGWERLPDESL